MSEISRPSSPNLSRFRTLTLPVVIGVTFFSAIWWWLRGQNAMVPAPNIPLEPEQIAVVEMPVQSPPRKQSPIRWLLYLGLTLCFIGLLIVLQAIAPELSTFLFLLLLLAGIGYGLSQSALSKGWRYAAQTISLEIKTFLINYAWIFSFIAVGLAFACMISSAYFLQTSLNFAPSFGQALQVFCAATAAIGVPLLLKPDPVIVSWSSAITGLPHPTVQFRWRVAFGRMLATEVGVLLLFLLAETNYNALGTSLLEHVHHLVQLAFLVFGIPLFCIGLGGRLRLPVMTRREIMWLGGVLLLALVLRSVALDSAIPRFIDEFNFVDAIPRLWAQPDVPILAPFSHTTAFTWLYPIVQSGFSNILGSGLLSLRLISVILGTLGVVATYFLVRTAFHNKVLALIAALILATLPVHMHFSRLGLNNIADPLFGTLALAFLIRGFQSHQRSDFIWAGASLGLTQYFYEGGRLLYPPLFIAGLIITWLWSKHRKADFVHGLYAMLVAVIIAAPVYYTLIGSDSFLTPRLQSAHTTVDYLPLLKASLPVAVNALRERFLYPLLMITSLNDQSWFYGGAQAIVLLVLVPFFLMGVAYAFWKLRSPLMPILLVWVLLTVLGNGLLQENLWMPRYVVEFPAIAIFVALGIYATVGLIWPAGRFMRGFYGVLIGLSLVLAGVQTYFYFHDQVPNYLQSNTAEDWNDAFYRMAQLPAGTQVHFIMDPPMWRFNIDAFLAYYRLDLTVDAAYPSQVTKAYLEQIASDSTVPQVFFVNPSREQSLALVRQYFVLGKPQWGAEFIPQREQLPMYSAQVKPH